MIQKSSNAIVLTGTVLSENVKIYAAKVTAKYSNSDDKNLNAIDQSLKRSLCEEYDEYCQKEHLNWIYDTNNPLML